MKCKLLSSVLSPLVPVPERQHPRRESDATTGARRRRGSSSHRSRRARRSHEPGGGGTRLGRSLSSTSSLSDDINNSSRRTAVRGRDRNSDESGSPGAAGRTPPRRKTKKQHRERKHHRQQRLDVDIDAALSRSSGEDGGNLAAGAGRGGKRQSRLKPELSSETPHPKQDGRYQPQDAVEARFDGRSKWFPSKVRVDMYQYME